MWMNDELSVLLLFAMNEIEPLMSLLAGKYGWVSGAVAWMGALRLAAKFISTRLQDGLTRIVQSKADPELLSVILNNKLYRLVAFLVDLFASVKLPNAKDLIT
jgi:hypothetical protein